MSLKKASSLNNASLTSISKSSPHSLNLHTHREVSSIVDSKPVINTHFLLQYLFITVFMVTSSCFPNASKYSCFYATTRHLSSFDYVLINNTWFFSCSRTRSRIFLVITPTISELQTLSMLSFNTGITS